MAADGEDNTLFFDFARDIDEIENSPEDAKKKLIARNPVLFQTTMFRAFLRLTSEETEDMGYQEFIDYTLLLTEVMKLWHAPYVTKEKVNTDVG